MECFTKVDGPQRHWRVHVRDEGDDVTTCDDVIAISTVKLARSVKVSAHNTYNTLLYHADGVRMGWGWVKMIAALWRMIQFCQVCNICPTRNDFLRGNCLPLYE